jgi:phage-related protein
VIAAFGVAAAFVLGPIYGVIAVVAGAFLMLRKAVSEFGTKSAADLGKSGGIVGFLEKIGGLITGVRAVFSSWSSDLKTFELSKELEEKLAKVGMLQTVKNIGTWLARFSEMWGGFKSGMSAAWTGIKKVFAGIASVFKPLTTQFEKWGILVSANTDSLDKWKTYGEYAAYALVGVLGMLTVAFTVMGVSALISMLPVILVVAAVGLAIYGLIKFIDWVSTSNSELAGTLRSVFSTLWEYIKIVGEAIWDVLKVLGAFIGDIGAAFRDLFSTGDFDTFFDSIGSAFSSLANGIMDIAANLMTTFWGAIADFLGVPEIFQNLFSGVFQSLVEHAKTAFSFIGVFLGDLYGAFANFFSGVVDAFKQLFKGDVLGLYNWYRGAVNDLISNIVGLLWSLIKNIGSAAWNMLKSLNDVILEFVVNAVSSIWGWLINKASEIGATLANMFLTIWGTFFNFLKSIPSMIGAAIDDMISSLGRFVGKTFAMFQRLPDRIRSIFSVITDAVKTWFDNTLNTVVTFFTELPNKLSIFFNDILTNF